MEGIKQKIIIGRNLGDIFKLPCVVCIRKELHTDEPVFHVLVTLPNGEKGVMKAHVGDEIIESKEGKWMIRK